MRCLIYSILLPLFAVGSLAAEPFSVQGRVLEVLPEAKALRVELTESASSDLSAGQTVDFRVGPGDLEIGYAERLIRAEAVDYSGVWHLERIFPVDGIGAKAMVDVNKQLHDATATMSRRKYVRQGDYIPNFAMIDQHGDFLQIREMRGKAFVLNFIFTRCRAATMCPASTTRMSELQEIAREDGMENLHFVTITFDPEYDSPGILRQYAQSYQLENDNFHLLTATQELVDDLLRQFGILTMEEDGTINHTMATLLVDANGRVAFRKEGSKWTTEEFIEAAKQL
ncbi:MULTISPECIES: SCO family protein [unclassified Lentimonas]|uniref:SCO family protein n=1 Tax=unclassified Lentimonas TaxID=2630993 RepID=UPI001320F4F8|nr:MULTISPECIES: SCO family protein [unclassified Lentimonas]CAA6692905.1 Cytochrome oxidase biogenesis protein Sco1/SenC/PrrC, putative copper metallochaperone [Lentimonas sp. CC19]CAA6695762.1 Cytochrome oxidase biogenesis protein Sco1/SenC/PrrC, putative copper metallochaperone [Lentimonas sp. CC10]CAA7069593.1 Cytochrome oxidase biogenesis protein Sco1/SenC/PrrC, putative copper metallochaperone [Lentimonas sp. CC11]